MLNFFANIFLMSATIICQRKIKKHGYDRAFIHWKKKGQTNRDVDILKSRPFYQKQVHQTACG